MHGIDRVWALVDSNINMQQPDSIFMDSLFFIVEAATPRAERTQWTNVVTSKTFYMKLWSFSEVLQAWIGSPHGTRDIYLSAAVVSTNRTSVGRARRGCGTCTSRMAHLPGVYS